MVFTACDKDETIAPQNCPDCTFDFYDNVAIEVGLNATNTVSLIPGNKIVFRFTKPVFNEASELTETRAILFEIGNDQDSFIFSGTDISGLFPHQGLDIDGPEGPAIMDFASDISEGTLEGSKISESEWRIVLTDVNTSFGTQTVSAIFNRR